MKHCPKVAAIRAGWRANSARRAPTPSTPTTGPGSDLKEVFALFRISDDGCGGCAALMTQMNIWGVSGCRQRREEILQQLRERAAKKSWIEKFKAAAAALSNPLLFSSSHPLDLLDPLAWCLDEALRRAEAKEGA